MPAMPSSSGALATCVGTCAETGDGAEEGAPKLGVFLRNSPDAFGGAISGRLTVAGGRAVTTGGALAAGTGLADAAGGELTAGCWLCEVETGSMHLAASMRYTRRSSRAPGPAALRSWSNVRG